MDAGRDKLAAFCSYCAAPPGAVTTGGGLPKLGACCAHRTWQRGDVSLAEVEGGHRIGHLEGNAPSMHAECAPMFVLMWLPTVQQQPCTLLPCTCAACQRTMCCRYSVTPHKGVSTTISTSCLSAAMLALASTAPFAATCHALQPCLLHGT